MCIDRRQRGMTLIELIVFIVIVSVALAGILTVFNITTKSSADPMIRKQMLSIAEGLLEEVMSQPFTWCDPNDLPQAETATAATETAGCSVGLVQSFGQPSGQVRSPTFTFNNVANYCSTQTGGSSCSTLTLPYPIPDVSNTHYAPTGYSAAIDLTAEALGGISSGAPTATDATAMNVLRITVTVCHATSCPSAGSDSIILEGSRTRHSPNMLP